MSLNRSRAFEKCNILYCSQCQQHLKFDKYNNPYFHPNYWTCCCYFLKIASYKFKCKVSEFNQISRSEECCSACVSLKIIPVEFNNISGNEYKTTRRCSRCSQYVLIEYMNRTFDTLYNAHEYARLQIDEELSLCLDSSVNIK